MELGAAYGEKYLIVLSRKMKVWRSDGRWIQRGWKTAKLERDESEIDWLVLGMKWLVG